MSNRDKTLSALGLNVRERREARALTQEKLAERAGLDATYISGIERGLPCRKSQMERFAIMDIRGG